MSVCIVSGLKHVDTSRMNLLQLCYHHSHSSTSTSLNLFSQLDNLPITDTTAVSTLFSSISHFSLVPISLLRWKNMFNQVKFELKYFRLGGHSCVTAAAESYQEIVDCVMFSWFLWPCRTKWNSISCPVLFSFVLPWSVCSNVTVRENKKLDDR